MHFLWNPFKDLWKGELQSSAPFKDKLQPWSFFSNPEILLGGWEGRERALCLPRNNSTLSSARGLQQPYKALSVRQPSLPRNQAALEPQQRTQEYWELAQGTPPHWCGISGTSGLGSPAAAPSSPTYKPSPLCFLQFSMPFTDKYTSLKWRNVFSAVFCTKGWERFTLGRGVGEMVQLVWRHKPAKPLLS